MKLVSHFVNTDDVSFELETGLLATNADAAVVVKSGKNFLLCTVTYGKKREKSNFLPMSVVYQERMSSVGKISGGFNKRDGRQSDKEILIGRLIDRSIRPMLDSKLRNEIQIICTLLGHEIGDSIEGLAVTGCSAAMFLSGIPMKSLVAGIFTKGENYEMMLSGTKKNVIMLESKLNNIDKKKVLSLIAENQKKLARIIPKVESFVKKASLSRKAEFYYADQEDLLNYVELHHAKDLAKIANLKSKNERRKLIRALCEKIAATKDLDIDELNEVVSHSVYSLVKKEILNGNRNRIDGRKGKEIRPISIEAGLLPNNHGSALFTRGETQTLVSLTFDDLNNAQMVENVNGVSFDNFILHYNFLPFSVGETGRIGSPNRREIGHGKLACKALDNILPEKMPYTVKLVSDILTCNGSSSMATVCASSVALMNGGINIREHVAGVAMGLLINGSNHVILTDISGEEDAFGDMDLKVTGTRKGITALQMDVKVSEVRHELLSSILQEAEIALNHILDKMYETISQAQSDTEIPFIHELDLEKKHIGKLIGPGGQNIKFLCKKYGAKIDISDDHKVEVILKQKSDLKAILKDIEITVHGLKVGGEYEGVVSGIASFGAFVKIGQSKGLLHIDKCKNLPKEGEVIKIKIDSIKDNRISLILV